MCLVRLAVRLGSAAADSVCCGQGKIDIEKVDGDFNEW